MQINVDELKRAIHEHIFTDDKELSLQGIKVKNQLIKLIKDSYFLIMEKQNTHKETPMERFIKEHY